jgi:hypothetical protein
MNFIEMWCVRNVLAWGMIAQVDKEDFFFVTRTKMGDS